MLPTVEGVYRNGRIEIDSLPGNIEEETKVLVIFVDSDVVNLADYGIDRSQAQAIRNSLITFADDWESPEMSVYDNYDAAQPQP